MAPFLWLALLLGYFAGLGAALVLLPGPVIEPLYGVLGLVTLLVVAGTAAVMVVGGRRAAVPPAPATPRRDPAPGTDQPPDGRMPEGDPAAQGPASDDGPGDRAAPPDDRSLEPGAGPAPVPDDGNPKGTRRSTALPVAAGPPATPIGASALQELLLEGRVDAWLRPLRGWPERPVAYHRAAAHLRAADGHGLRPQDYLPSARRAGLIGLIEAVLALRCAQIIWQAGAEGRELCVLAPVSPASLNDASFVGQLERLIGRHPDLPARLVLELDQLRLDAPALRAQARLRRLGWRFGLRRLGPPVLDLAALSARGFSFVGLDAPRHALDGSAIPAELRGIQERVAGQGITLLVNRTDAAPSLIELADRPAPLDHDLRFAEPRQSAA